MILFLSAVVLGVIFQYLHVGEEAIKLATKFLFYVGLPILIIDSILSSHFNGYILVPIIHFLFISLAVFYFACKKLPFHGKHKGSLFLIATYGNMGFLGIPLAQYLFGSKGALYASLLAVSTGIVHYTLGVSLAGRFVHKKKKIMEDVMSNPFIYAVALGAFLKWIGVDFPNMLRLMHPVTTYLAILIIAFSLELRPHTFRVYWKQIVTGTIFRLLASPLIMFLIVALLPIDSYSKSALITLGAMPPALTNTAISKQLELAPRMCGSVTAILTGMFFLGLAMALGFG